MFTQAVETHIGGLSRTIGNTIAALLLAFFGFGTIAIMSGAEAAQAPLVWVIAGTTLASVFVGVITGSVTGDAETEAERQRAYLAFAFTNSAGALAAVVGNLAETLDKGHPPSENAITYMLHDVREAPNFMLTYGCIVAGIVIAAVICTTAGSIVMARRASLGPGHLQLLTSSSVVLMVVGIAVGTTWADVPSAKEVATVWRIGLLVVGLIITVIWAQFVAAATGGLIGLVGRKALNAGRQLTTVQFWTTVGRTVGKAAFEIGWRVALAAAIYVVEIVALVVIRMAWAVTTVSFRIAQKVLWDAFLTTLPVAAAATAVATLGLCLFLVWKVMASPTWRAVSAILSSVRAAPKKLGAAYGSLKKHAQSVRADGVRFLTWIWQRFRSQTIETPPRKPWRSFTASLAASATSLLSLVPTRLLAVGPRARGAVIAMLLVTAASFVPHQTIRPGTLPSGPAPATDEEVVFEAAPFIAAPSELQIDPVQVPIILPPPPLRDLKTRAVSLCALSPAGFDWALGRSDRFTVSMRQCDPPEEATGHNSLVVVGMSSAGSDLEKENRRARQRGQAIAKWVAARTPNDIQVYVLDLGMASGPEALDSAAYLFGDIESERPALGLIVRPIPSDAYASQIDIALELSDRLTRARLSSNFSKCDLYLYNRFVGRDGEFRLVPFFSCGKADAKSEERAEPSF
jgi:hypothetical protein